MQFNLQWLNVPDDHHPSYILVLLCTKLVNKLTEEKYPICSTGEPDA